MPDVAEERETVPWTGGEPADEEVVRRVLQGEVPLFEVLMRRYNQRLYRVARAVLGGDGEAEDVMQQAYLEAFAHLAQFEGRASFATWLTRIAVHAALARVRKRGRFRPSTPVPEGAEGEEDAMSRIPSSGPDPEEEALRGEMRGLLESAVEALPASYRSVFVLRHVEGLSTSEAAACLELKEDAVKTRLHRARALLREDLYRRAGGEARGAFPFHAPRCDRVVAAVLARLSARVPEGPREPAAE